MEPSLRSLSQVLEHVDERLMRPDSDTRIWQTGFPLLDDALGGGMRSGALHLLAGAQGEGKTTYALQMARHAAKTGRPVIFFSYELEPEVLLQKLVAAEAAEVPHGEFEQPMTVFAVREVFEGNDGLDGGLPERMSSHVGGLDALAAVSEYAPRLMIHRSTTTATHLEVLKEIVEKVIAEHGESPLVVIDYLQKVRPGRPLQGEEAISHVAESLKDMAYDIACPVLAISASDSSGLEVGKRLRARNLKGSTSLAYEADVVLVLSNKADVVARHHLVYGANNGDAFREWSVLTIEKNRSGRTGAEIEFRKQFTSGRFLPEGSVVTEDLVDERIFVE